MIGYRLPLEGHAVYENYENEILDIAVSSGGRCI